MKTNVLITAIICITALVSIALYKGQDGLLLAGAIGAICGLAGYIIPAPKK